MCKYVLFIAPESYPINAAEAIVNIKLLKSLSDAGYRIDLISKKSKWENYPSTQNIEEMGIKLNSFVCIQVDNKLTLKTIWQHFRCFLKFGVVFKGAHWALKVLENEEARIKNNQYDYIITKSSPSLLVANYLKSKYGFKWVASWNDPYPAIRYPAPYGKGVHEKLPFLYKGVDQIMKNADIHVFPTHRLRDYMLNYLDVNRNKTVIIPHIAHESNDNITITTKDKLRIIHSGNLSYPRDARNFIYGLSKFVNLNKDFPIEVDLVGRVENDISLLIVDLKLQNIVRVMPPVNYEQSLTSLRNYDVALIIEANCEEGIFLPTKVGDYMQYRKTIFAISPAVGVLSDLFNENLIQYLADITDVDQILDQLMLIAEQFIENSLKESVYCEAFSEKRVVNQYDMFFSNLI